MSDYAAEAIRFSRELRHYDITYLAMAIQDLQKQLLEKERKWNSVSDAEIEAFFFRGKFNYIERFRNFENRLKELNL